MYDIQNTCHQSISFFVHSGCTVAKHTSRSAISVVTYWVGQSFGTELVYIRKCLYRMPSSHSLVHHGAMFCTVARLLVCCVAVLCERFVCCTLQVSCPSCVCFVSFGLVGWNEVNLLTVLNILKNTKKNKLINSLKC